MSWISFDCLAWQPAPMPYGSGPVEVASLPYTGGGFLAFVRFPPGWIRSTPVVYKATEEFVIIEGTLRVNDTIWAPNSYGSVGAGVVRHITESLTGCLAWARFHGSPRALRLESVGAPASPREDALVSHDLSNVPAQSGPGSERHWLLREKTGETWLSPQFDDEQLHLKGQPCDALSLQDRSWWSGELSSADVLKTCTAAVVHRHLEVSL